MEKSTMPDTGSFSPSILEVCNVDVEYGASTRGVFGRRTRPTRALASINLSLRKGETLGLVGESGSGKTTLARTIMGLLPPSAGSVWLNGEDVTVLGKPARKRVLRSMQMIFQDPLSSLHPRRRVADAIAEPLRIHGIGTATGRREAALELLNKVGLSSAQADRYPQHFSGGQRQRIAIARALALDPDLIVADEPVSALDVSVQADILNLLQAMRSERNMAMLFISHDLAVVRHLCDRIGVMYLGRLIEIGSGRAVTEQPMHPYTTALLSAAPKIAASGDSQSASKPIVLSGEIPNHQNPPSGCPFHTRCWLAAELGHPERCRASAPPLQNAFSGHQVACHFHEQAHHSRPKASSG